MGADRLMRVAAGCLLVLCSTAAAGQPAGGDVYIPAPLEPWRDWVLHGHEHRLECPFVDANLENRPCLWPARLSLDVSAAGARFEQQVTVYARAWVPLPGSRRHWPQNVTVDRRPAEVVARNGGPALYLDAGEYRLAGRLAWDKRPESLPVPAGTALLELTLDGRPVAVPNLDGDGTLWLGRDGRREEGAVENTLQLKVFRKFTDAIPPRLTTELRIEAGGRAREVVTGRLLPEGFVPLSTQSDLPARIEPDGRLRLQLRAGSFTLTSVARHLGAVETLAMERLGEPWPEQELWAFEMQRQLRTVQLSGAPAVDARTTDMPAAWRDYPVYLLTPDTAVQIEPLYRGDPDQADNRLDLHRTLWLDFDGGGYTLVDRISGRMQQEWRLALAPPFQLGRVEIAGEAQPITRLSPASPPGVEIRSAGVDVEAVSRYEAPVGRVPAAGWNNPFQRIDAVLHLPPGWRLFAASGPDTVQTSWIGSWSLWDIFIVVLTAVAAGRLWGWKWGVLALAALVLGFGEPYAPFLLWLNAVLALAVLRVVPAGRFRQVLSGYRNLSLLALVLLIIPFAVNQARLGVYPQLEKPHLQTARTLVQETRPLGQAPEPEQDDLAAMEQQAAGSSLIKEKFVRQRQDARKPPDYRRYYADAQIGTGPGVPQWQWNRVDLAWSGPVDEAAELDLWLISPPLFRVLAFVKIAVVALFAAMLIGVGLNRTGWLNRLRLQARGRGLAMLLCAVTGAALFVPSPPARAEVPPPELLEQLRQRLLEPPACAPHCAAMESAAIRIRDDRLHIDLRVHAEHATAIGLPAQRRQWLPGTVLLGGRPAPALRLDEDGRLQLALPAGRHSVELNGPVDGRDELHLPVGLPAHNVTFDLEGWRATGLVDGQVRGASLHLQRELPVQARDGDGQPDGDERLLPTQAPPFFEVERRLAFDFDWKASTTVTRLAPGRGAVTVEIPLLPGESVTGENVTARDGRAILVFDERTRVMSWRSVLAVQPQLTLSAPGHHRWAEVWTVTASPLWHLGFDGIPEVHRPDDEQWIYRFRPWSGEALRLTPVRPDPVEGRSLTLRAARLEHRVGTGTRESVLTLDLLSSRGGDYSLALPPDSEFLGFVMDGRTRPLAPREGVLQIPLTPGHQQAEIRWRQAGGAQLKTATPAVALGRPATNVRLDLALPADRWPLLVGGPQVGPAVLFWGYLIVMIAVAWALGRTGLTPLRARHWLLLGLGISVSTYPVAVLVVFWLFALAARRRMPLPAGSAGFNTLQIGLAVLTVITLVALISAIPAGLLGRPDMHITGNGSDGGLLHWYKDATAGPGLPQGWVISLPLWSYRLAMLTWSLWLAFALTGWLKWGWECFSRDGLWRGHKKGE